MAERKTFVCDVCGARIDYPHMGYILRVDMPWVPIPRRHICGLICLSWVEKIFKVLKIKYEIIPPIKPNEGRALDWGILIIKGLDTGPAGGET